jgi:hypothetical protein
MLFAADTEGCLLIPGCAAPPLVCLQFKVDAGNPELIHVRDPACKRTVEYAVDHALWSFHNLAHDIVSLMAEYGPEMTERLFWLLDQDRATCTIVRQKLLDIAKGRFKGTSKRGYSLDVVAQALGCAQVVNKEDPWRMRYGELIDVPVPQWPADAIKYALGDAIAQSEVHTRQELNAQKYNIPLVDQFRQTRACVWLRLTEAHGIMVDPVRVEEYLDTVNETLKADREVCIERELARRDATGTKDLKRATAHMIACCRESEAEDLPVTKTGEKHLRAWLGIHPQDTKTVAPIGATWRWYEATKPSEGISLDEDACRDYGDELLEAFQRYGTSTLQIGRAMRLYTAAKRGIPIQPRFNKPQDSGRISCSQGDVKGEKTPTAFGAQMQNPAKDKKIKRLCPVGWGEREGEKGPEFFNPLTGETRPKFLLRKGTRECFVPRPGHAFLSTDWEGAEASAVAQVCIWTPGIGFSRMAQIINAGGNLPTEFGAQIAGISAEQAYAIRKAGGDAKKAFDSGPRQSAKIALYGYFGGMGPKKLKWQAKKLYDVRMSLGEAEELRRKLFVFAPEIPLFHRHGSNELRNKETTSFVQFGSGRLRGGCWYSALLNTKFQGLISDIFGDAGWQIMREMYVVRDSPLYGCRQVPVAAHDDVLSEVPLDRIHEAGTRQAQLMTEVGRKWCPDVALRCDPAAMLRWYKDAEAVWKDGRLQLWEPKNS